MIPIDRNNVPAPSSITSHTGPGARERAKVMLHYSVPNCHTFDFSAYKEKDVVVALNILFMDKCAYCESRITNTGPIDVKHFRPKGAVAEDSAHSGYWWLASEWTNLLPSCIDCNRARYQVIAQEDKTQGELLSGKKDAFPIAGAQRAICSTDDHTLEDPLLIDPTSRDPSQHISWNFKNSAPLAVPHITNSIQDQYGQTSIRSYGLNRIKLAEARLGSLLILKNDIINVSLFIDDISTLPIIHAQAMMPALERLLEALYKKSAPDQQFSSCLRYYINEELRIIYERMRSLNLKLKADWS